MRLLAAIFLAPQERSDACPGHGCGVTGSSPFRTPCSSLPRGRGDQLPSEVQLFFAVCFDWHLAGKHASLFKVEQMMFLNSNQGCLPEVQTYNAIIAAHQEDEASAFRMCNRHKRRLLGRRWMSKYKRVGTNR